MGKSYDRLGRTYTGDGRVLDNGVEVYARYPGGYYADEKYYWYGLRSFNTIGDRLLGRR